MSLMSLKNIEMTEAVPAELALQYLALSIALGIVLMIIAVWSSKKIGQKLAIDHTLAAPDNSLLKEPGKFEKSLRTSYVELVMSSSNVLFLCFGMTGIMILVNNNLARAFAIGAAIAVIRFRVKFDDKGLGSTLFFGVLVGMACGVGQVQTALVITTTYGILQAIIIFLISLETQSEKLNRTSQALTRINTRIDTKTV